MTSEVIVMNRSAIAIAADSASTVTGEKIFNADKIFMLSKYRPIGIMIYGNSHFMGIPWETVIKTYRRQLSTQTFDDVVEYANNFFEYINQNKVIFSEENNDAVYKGTIIGVLSEVRGVILNRIGEIISIEGKIADETVEDIINQEIKKIEEKISKNPMPECFEEKDIIFLNERYSQDFKAIFPQIFEKLPMSDFYPRIVDLVSRIFIIRILCGDHMSGVVFAGFGEKEIFPKFHEYIFFGYLNDSLRNVSARTGYIDVNHNAFISSFAQGDMIQTFMEGIAPDLKNFYNQSIPEVFDEYKSQILRLFNIKADELPRDTSKLDEFNKKFLQSYSDQVSKIKRTNHIEPVLSIVGHLPKEELAEMAESLVNLTSLKRRVSTEPESVGGPIDVAVISKGDGFIWMKRKHYFDIHLNPHFEKNYYSEVNE